MKLAASNPSEQRRQLLILAGLVLVAVIVGYTQFGGAAAEVAPPASNAQTTPAGVPGAQPPRNSGGNALPEPLRLKDLEPVPEQVTGARNPFGFGSRPLPPAPPPAEAPPPRPVVAPPPTPPGPPPLPPIQVKFLGFVEDPTHPGKVVALGINGGVVIAREGELVDGRYRLVKVGLESIVMAYPDGRGQTTIRLSGQ